MTEQMQNKKIDELTNKIRMVESELHRLEEDAFKKQEELTITVSRALKALSYRVPLHLSANILKRGSQYVTAPYDVRNKEESK